jgi:hypothetical protein
VRKSKNLGGSLLPEMSNFGSRPEEPGVYPLLLSPVCASHTLIAARVRNVPGCRAKKIGQPVPGNAPKRPAELPSVPVVFIINVKGAELWVIDSCEP